MLTRKLPKTKTCKVCSKEFAPALPLAQVCGARCGLRYARKIRDEEKALLKERKQAIKTIPQLKKEAQVAFNAFIRERDKGQPCICCGKPLGQGDVGGAYDAGHYRSTGSAPHLRFDERNCHAQRKACNRYGAGRAVDYRIGLLSRIGSPEVEALEADNRIHKWTREELIAIRDTYKAKAKALKSAAAHPADN